VSLALSALEKHSQNDLLYDTKKVHNLSSEDFAQSDTIFDWSGLPFNTKTRMEEFKVAFYE